MLRRDRHGQGYATDAARSLIAFGFTQLRLHRITAAMAPDNTGSAALARRLGMRYEGRLRGHVELDDGWRDSLLFSILAEDQRD